MRGFVRTIPPAAASIRGAGSSHRPANLPETRQGSLMKKILLTALIAMAGSVGAHAEGIYVGVAAGGTNLDLDCAGAPSCDKSDTGFKLFGGYKLTENIAV